MRKFRYWIGRHLIHLGLAAFPEGPVKDELYSVLAAWGRHVLAAVEASKTVVGTESAA